MHSCSVYGLGVSINVRLAALQSLGPARRTDVVIHVGELPDFAGREESEPFYSTDELDDDGSPLATIRRLRSGYFRIDYSDGTRVVVDAAGSRVWTTGGAGAEDTAVYLLGPVMGFVLRLRGVMSLHASAVAFGGRAALFAGPSGAGKSSVAAAFARAGNAVLCDDIAPVHDRGGHFVVEPAYPRLRLWSDSVDTLFGSADAMPRIVPNWDKRFVDLSAPPFAFQQKALPVAAIYVLDAERAGPAVGEISPRAALMSLVRESYTTRLLDREMRAAEFALLGRLVESVSVRRLCRGTSLGDAESLCAVVRRDFEAIAAH